MCVCVCMCVSLFCVCLSVCMQTSFYSILQMSKSCSTLVVYWTKPHSNGSPVTAYHIELNGKRATTVTGSLTEATLTNLTPQTDYKYVQHYDREIMCVYIPVSIYEGSEYSLKTELVWAHSGNIRQCIYMWLERDMG